MSRLSFSDSFSKSNYGKDKNFKGDRFGILFDGRSIDHGHGDTNDAASGRLNILRNGLLIEFLFGGHPKNLMYRLLNADSCANRFSMIIHEQKKLSAKKKPKTKSAARFALHRKFHHSKILSDTD